MPARFTSRCPHQVAAPPACIAVHPLLATPSAVLPHGHVHPCSHHISPSHILSRAAAPAQGFTGGGVSSNTRFSIELPVADQGAATTVQVTGSVLRQLEKATGRMVVVFADSAAAELARKSSGMHQVLSLQQACQQDSLSLPLLLVEPAVADVSGCLLLGP
jgi:hypothetical protein